MALKNYLDHMRNGHKRSWFHSNEKKYDNGYADFGDFRVYDKEVAEYTKAHLKFFDRFDMRKVTEAVLYSFSILSKSVEPPEGDNWKF